jgi:hypothetical protein
LSRGRLNGGRMIDGSLESREGHAGANPT